MSGTKEEKEIKKIIIKTVEIATNKAERLVAERKEQENKNKKEKK